jgi:hypothetical protein
MEIILMTIGKDGETKSKELDITKMGSFDEMKQEITSNYKKLRNEFDGEQKMAEDEDAI